MLTFIALLRAQIEECSTVVVVNPPNEIENEVLSF